MRVHELIRNVTSNTQVRCSSGSSNETHSWMSFGASVFTARTLQRAKMVAVHELVDDLRAHLAPERVRAEPLELSLYGHDASIVRGGRVAVVCFPISTEEVQACVRVARVHGRPF